MIYYRYPAPLAVGEDVAGHWERALGPCGEGVAGQWERALMASGEGIAGHVGEGVDGQWKRALGPCEVGVISGSPAQPSAPLRPHPTMRARRFVGRLQKERGIRASVLLT